MSVEEAKRRLLDPPPEAFRRPFLEDHAGLLVLGAFVVGFFIGTPRRIIGLGGLGFRLFTSPLAQKTALPLLLAAVRRSRR